MRLYAGTSGYSYKEWKGNFYPEDLPARDMLRFYGACLPAVEINNTFYRLPRTNVLESWAGQVPEGFRFSIKASRRITHIKRLKGAEEETAYLFGALQILGPRLGVVLFQLPPHLKKDRERLQQFLNVIPQTVRAAFEFRHSSWLADDVLQCLHDRGFAWCISDTDEAEAALLAVGRWGYLRLRRSAYGEADLARWVEHVAGENWEEAFVFFKHEDAGTGPKLARRFLELASETERLVVA